MNKERKNQKKKETYIKPMLKRHVALKRHRGTEVFRTQCDGTLQSI